MLILKGHLLHIFTQADYVNKETGEVVKGKTKLQLLVKKPMRNGGYKNELLDISIPKEKIIKYKGKENSDVEVEVATIGKCQFYGI
ncbi:hypothetical protein [Nitrosophilus kaiyonis]|uniref:hypothetical protein n=1 Tax=Nitrosophilus kaiyonis TaxID=2930200 RepID=UPI002490A213|nr:hypothetical protein [Nitrosophilus kaiyonis]